jgi:cell division protein FtsW
MTDTEKAVKPRLIDRLPVARKNKRGSKENVKETEPKIIDFLKASYRGIDKVFLMAVILLVAFGTLMVFSAGTAYAEKRYGDIFYFVKRQTIWILIGFAVMMGASQIPIKQYKKYTPHLYGVTILLLLLVLIVGFVGNGAKRWISIGPLTIQPSEIAKLTMPLAIARYFSEFEDYACDLDNKKNAFIRGTLLPCLILLVPVILVMLQKHLSCIIILGAIGITLIFVAGVDPRYIYAFIAVAIVGVTALALLTDYTKDRITVWQDPEQYKLTGGWQTLQGLMAIGSGGIFGVGYGNSVLKHCYVSEPANDMIFAILCEELGFIGAFLAIALFGLLVWRGIVIGMSQRDTYSRLAVFGIMIKIATQVLLNIAVVTNTIPNTGISLPFFSYGGSSLIMIFFEMGIILSISKERTASI